MARINDFFLKNFYFKYVQDFYFEELNLNNEEFFKKPNKKLNSFGFQTLNLKKINLNRKCFNIFYF